MDNTVCIVKCPDYESVEERLVELLTMVKGVGNFAAPGEKIILKVNLLKASDPSKAVTTHPSIVAAVARMLKKEGAIPIIADSPGSGYKYNKKMLDKTYETCGMYRVAEEVGAEVNFDTTYQTVSFPEGQLIKRFEIITSVLEADGVFNLCKLKTHLFMHLTGAVKNNFGVIPGLAKPGYHAKLRDKNRFASMLLDLAEYVSPRISIMDAVLCMEGEGPGAAGTPRHVGLLIASKSPLALDVVAGKIIGLSREKNPVLVEAGRRGMYPNHIEEVEVLGVNLSDISIPDYQFPATIFSGVGLGGVKWWQRALTPLIKAGMTLKPRVIKSKCTACSACKDSCPMGIITMVNGKYAQINEKECIRCYCCHEMCQFDAIKLHQSLIYRTVNR